MFWAPLAPITQPVLYDGREIPVTFRFLSDAEEEQVVLRAAAEPLNLPDRPATLPENLEPLWQQDMARRVAALRSAQETRYRMAYAIVDIGGKDFTRLSLEQRIAEITTWLGGVVDACEAAYYAARLRPFQLFEQYEADPDFGSAPLESGASSNGADSGTVAPSPFPNGLSPEFIAALMTPLPSSNTTSD
jgi:hypothetical protein